MATLAEVLKSAGIADDVVAGLPKEVSAALTGFVSDAETKLSTAAEDKRKAEEVLRQAGLDRKEIEEYVNRYESSLNEQGSTKARLDAALAYIESLKTQGFDVKLPEPTGDGKKPAVPGSPAIGGNAVDEGKILGKVGSVMSQWLDANNEHIRLYGVPIPDPSTTIGDEAARARMSIGDYLSQKYKFAEKRREKADADNKAKVDADVKAKVDELERQRKEREGSNPNLRGGESSRASIAPKIEGKRFHESDGNVPTRERHKRLLENLHKDVEAIRSVA